MCTVSFVRVKDTVIITSNRDEHIHRKNAAAPVFHQLQNKKIIFPKDAKAGGTWFAAADNGIVAVLLNGAFVKHIAQPPYRKSRGIILLEIIEAADPFLFFTTVNLNDIEPFTVVLSQPGSLHELRWDGKNKHDNMLGTEGNYIWSSATLYTADVIARREKLFDLFIHETKNITPQLVHQFHNYNAGDDENGFIINRQSGMKTFSVTQAVIRPETITFSHTDLLQHLQFEETIFIKPASIPF